jgi:S1-C subfamily serine protease
MFAEAYKIASQFTRPVVISVRRFDGSLENSQAAFVILNKDGWIATAAHVFELGAEHEANTKEIADYDGKVAAIEGDTSATDKQKRKRKDRLSPNRKWIMNISWWWGENSVSLQDFKVLPAADLAIGRLEPFDASKVLRYPVLKNPKNLPGGTSLCKLGYPFSQVPITFDETTSRFTLSLDGLSLPRFPIEGIYTRYLVVPNSDYRGHVIKFLETSSPGLRGQSGGPIFDSHGTVWAIQSHTVSLPLDFNTKALRNGREEEVPQFLNVGVGVHPELLTEFLRDNGVAYEESDY